MLRYYSRSKQQPPSLFYILMCSRVHPRMDLFIHSHLVQKFRPQSTHGTMLVAVEDIMKQCMATYRVHFHRFTCVCVLNKFRFECKFILKLHDGHVTTMGPKSNVGARFVNDVQLKRLEGQIRYCNVN